MNEAKLITKYKSYQLKNPEFELNKIVHKIEFKICKEKKFRFDQVKPHQIMGLFNSEKEGFQLKISDSPIFQGNKTRFTSRKPFDYLYIPATKDSAFVGIAFYVKRKKLTLYLLTVQDFIQLQTFCLTTKNKKSISETGIHNHSKYIISLMGKK